MIKKILSNVVFRTATYLFLFAFAIFALFVIYRFTPHVQSTLVVNQEVKSFWKWGKVYKQEIYKGGHQQPWKVIVYERKHVVMLINPNIKTPAIESHFIEDNNDDGNWDREGWWDGQTYEIKEDTDFDGKYDKIYKLKAIIF